MLSFVPETLHFFFRSLCPPQSKPKDVKIAAIGQALIKLARPNTILCLLLLAFAAEIHHKSGGSEFVVQLLHSMGFGSSIEKVGELEKSLCFHGSSPSIVEFNELWGLPLYSADNADILQATLDGKNTVHMMGIIRNVIKQGSMQQNQFWKSIQLSLLSWNYYQLPTHQILPNKCRKANNTRELWEVMIYLLQH